MICKVNIAKEINVNVDGASGVTSIDSLGQTDEKNGFKKASLRQVINEHIIKLETLLNCFVANKNKSSESSSIGAKGRKKENKKVHALSSSQAICQNQQNVKNLIKKFELIIYQFISEIS